MTKISQNMIEAAASGGSGLDDPHNSARKLFARRLFRAITERGWTQADLARRADLNRASVNKYIQGQILPSPDSLLRLAQALGVRPIELLPTETPGELAPIPSTPQVSLSTHPDGSAVLTVNVKLPTQVAMQVLALIHGALDVAPGGAPAPV